jgi:hypothetical protein
MSAAQRKCLGDGVLIYFVKIAIVWRLITRLAQLFCQTRGGEGVTALPGRPQCECLSRRPFKTYPTDVDSVRLGRPAERSGFFFWNADVVPLCRRKSATKVGCCVPLLTHLRSHTSTASAVVPRSGFLAPARLLPGLFFGGGAVAVASGGRQCH